MVLQKVKLCITIMILFNVAACNGNNKKELALLSKKMYESGNVNYVLVDAVSDGFLKDGEPFTFSNKNGIISFNNKQLEEPYLSLYRSKIERLPIMQVEDIVITSTKLQIKSIDNKYNKDLETAMIELIGVMHRDGLTNNITHFEIKLDSSGLYLNKNKVSDVLHAKYTGILEKNKVKPKNTCKNFIICYAKQ